MPWIEKSAAELAKELGVNIKEMKAKQRIISAIVKARKERGWTQAALSKKVGVTQSRIAQIESGVGTAKVKFDVLLNILAALDIEYRITLKRTA